MNGIIQVKNKKFENEFETSNEQLDGINSNGDLFAVDGFEHTSQDNNEKGNQVYKISSKCSLNKRSKDLRSNISAYISWRNLLIYLK